MQSFIIHVRIQTFLQRILFIHVWMDGYTPTPGLSFCSQSSFLYYHPCFLIIIIHFFHPRTTANAHRRERERERESLKSTVLVLLFVCVCEREREEEDSRDEERSRDEAALRPPLRLQLDRSAKREEICAA